MLSDEIWRQFEDYVAECIGKAPVLGQFLQGKLRQEDLKAIALRFYAEVRTFVDLKLPCRMRLCPHDAVIGKKYFWEIYKEEQGDFMPGKNHAEWFKSFCAVLELSGEDLEREYKAYVPRYSYLLTEEPSYEAMIRELAISYAWETTILVAGPRVIQVLIDKLRLHESQLDYFTGHLVVDEGHSELALNALKAYVTTSATMETARRAVHNDLVVSHVWAN
jgi:pyrroloquinoline quinone (PQQ) biosynthesis protein C